MDKLSKEEHDELVRRANKIAQKIEDEERTKEEMPPLVFKKSCCG